jgi:hypothetical protein
VRPKQLKHNAKHVTARICITTLRFAHTASLYLTLNRRYFPTQNYLIVFVMQTRVLCDVETKHMYAIQMSLRRPAVDLSRRRPGFDPRPIHMMFVVDKVAP